MKTLTICGSMRYKDLMQDTAYILQAYHDCNILQCVYKPDYIKYDKDNIETLKKMHFHKIDLSDGIFVIDKDGYIGVSTKIEINYAISKNKKVIYYSDFIKTMTI